MCDFHFVNRDNDMWV